MGLPHSRYSPTVSGRLGVHHRAHDVDEGHGRVHGAEEVGALVDHGAHEQAAGAAALDQQPVGRGPLLADQELGAVDEVEERVPLLHQHAVVVPGLAQLVAAADVGDRDGDPAVEQAQPPLSKLAGRPKP